MENTMFSKGDIKTYGLEELKGKTLEIIAAGENKNLALIYGRDIKSHEIFVIQVNSSKNEPYKSIRCYPKDIQANSVKDIDFTDIRIPMFAIYDHPIEYPNSYVARLWDNITATNVVLLSDDLEELRKKMPYSMIPIKRSMKDDKCLIETWV